METLIVIIVASLPVLWLITGARNPFWKCPKCSRWLSMHDKTANMGDGVHGLYRCKCGHEWLEDYGCW